MAANEKPSFLYLNGAGRWEGFDLSGLTVDPDGPLHLVSLPLLETDLPPQLETLGPPSGPAGIAFDPDSSLYFTQPDNHSILRRDGCNPQVPPSPVPCVGGQGQERTQFNTPRGLLYHPIRRALFVADSGNNRIQIFDVRTFQLLDVWGRHGAEPECLDSPWCLAADPKGNVYVVDHGNKRVQKFDLRGTVMPNFWETAQSTLAARQSPPLKPVDVAVGSTAEHEIRVYVLDSNAQAVFVFDEEGRFERSFGQQSLENPQGLAVSQDAAYVGHNPSKGPGRVIQFNAHGELIGGGVGYEGPVAALVLDSKNGLWVHTGGSLLPIQLAAKKGFARKGCLYGGPFKNPSIHPQEWHQFEATLTPGEDSYFQFFVFASTDDTPPPLPGTGPRWAGRWRPLADGFVPGQWMALPVNVDAGMIPAAQPDPQNPSLPKHLNYIWIGAEFEGEGHSTPKLSQIRLEFDNETLLKYLPAVYAENDNSRLFLCRFLSLFESLFEDLDQEISGLPRLFDPLAAPPEWLPWLAGWLALELYDQWPELQKRQTIAQAFESYAHGGTPEGLRNALQLFAGIDARIEEPFLSAAWWSLPENNSEASAETANSVLGFTTMLAPAEPQGAVAGTTAILDQAHLTTGDDFGEPLFKDVAHQFSVVVYRGQVNTPDKLAQVQALIDREKPAHTACHVCVIEPRLRVGFQARIGIDTVIAGPPMPTGLSDSESLTPGLILVGTPPGRVGGQNRIGITTQLEDAAVDGPALGF